LISLSMDLTGVAGFEPLHDGIRIRHGVAGNRYWEKWPTIN